MRSRCRMSRSARCITRECEMAKDKDNRVIKSGVLVDVAGEGRVFGPGQEDELEEVMTAEQLETLKLQGALEGDWSAKAKGGPILPEAVKERKENNARRNLERLKKAAEKAKAETEGGAKPPPVPSKR